MSLLPSRGPETSTSQDGELQIVGVDEDVSAVLDALSSETAREILNAVYEEPGTASDLAERLDMSIQKVSYHLDKLEEEELIAIAGTQYSEKGQEMNVFEPPEDPLVLFVGTPDRKNSLRALAERLLPVVGVLTAASAMVQFLFGTMPGLFGSPETGGESDPQVDAGGADATGTPEPTSEPTATPTESGGVEILEETEPSTPVEDAEPMTERAVEATEAAATAASDGGLDLEPGVAFFLGGLLVVTVVTVMWLYTR